MTKQQAIAILAALALTLGIHNFTGTDKQLAAIQNNKARAVVEMLSDAVGKASSLEKTIGLPEEKIRHMIPQSAIDDLVDGGYFVRIQRPDGTTGIWVTAAGTEAIEAYRFLMQPVVVEEAPTST